MEFRLTYEGPLYADKFGKPRAKHKHDIRRVFHKQLRGLWDHHPVLKGFKDVRPHTLGGKSIYEDLADKFHQDGYRFLPLVTRGNSLLCRIQILMLRPGEPGGVLSAGDIDNRLKTLFDALRKPSGTGELAGAIPEADEDPFFCLLEDDKFITHAAVETDSLLKPVTGDAMVQLVIKVRVRSYGGPAMSQIFDGG
jgi:hypothetical protein